MLWNLKDDALLRSYLLGKLPEGKTDRLECRLMQDDKLFELCEAVEADLMAAYARGELSATEGERVLGRLAASRRGRERLALARALDTIANPWESRPAAAPVVPFRPRAAASAPRLGIAALAASVFLAVIGALWFALPALHQQGAQPRVANQISAPARPGAPRQPARPVSQAPAAEKPRTGPDHVAQRNEPAPAKQHARPKPLPAVIVLSLTTYRGAEGATVETFTIPADKDLVQIRLDAEGFEDLGSFHAAVRSKEHEHETVWEKGGLRPRRMDGYHALVLDIPAGRLSSGRYEVTVTAGTEEITREFDVVLEKP